MKLCIVGVVIWEGKDLVFSPLITHHMCFGWGVVLSCCLGCPVMYTA